VVVQRRLELLAAHGVGARGVGERPGQGGRRAGRTVVSAIADPPGIELIDHAPS